MKLNNQETKSGVLIRKISEAEIDALLLNFDLADDGTTKYMYNYFADIISENIPEYAFAFHREELDSDNYINLIREGAKSVMKIKEIKVISDLIDKNTPDAQWPKDLLEKFENKGFFSEIILHFLLKELYGTVPLVSKIYFKDSSAVESHGFDAVHVDNECIWLGETKFYCRKNSHAGKDGIMALIEDLNTHFCKDYLNEQFLIIRKGLKNSRHPERDKWLSEIEESKKLSDKFKKIKIPLLCIYQSGLVSEDKIVDTQFDGLYLEEIEMLKKYFDDNNNFQNKNKTEIVLILLPVESKKKIVRLILDKLYHQQSV